VEIGRHEFLRAKTEVLCAMTEANCAFSHEIAQQAAAEPGFWTFSGDRNWDNVAYANPIYLD
jgi:hypothetical protein